MKNKGLKCSYEQCERDANCKGYCGTHYVQFINNKVLHDINTPALDITPEQHDEIVQRVAQGQSVMDIAAEMGFHYSTVSIAYKRHTGYTVREYKARQQKAGVEE